MAGTLVAIDFRLFPDNHQMPDKFTLGGVEFENLDAPASLFVNETSGDRGLQFKQAGLRVSPLAGTNAALVTVGKFAGDILVEAKDYAGQVVFSRKIQTPNSYTRVLVQGVGVTRIELTGGGNEGIVSEIVVPC